ncbi:hypothetical protein KSF_101270 [Reticulibacter mediterranei]|uniref:Uncharacterized protein n=1 Tax=Reticulibacter mediterranei TaxID=2778369 RepID=A0A8J3IQG5_9CHLR|nr:hypothetical protein [Reticulibacter mediterranei]GHP00080.1 hypothetical protein KSF_101270 [Reticulibacter mediterranei]
MLKNLGEALEGLLARHLAAHRRGQAEKSLVPPLAEAQAKQLPRLHRKAAELSQAKREERLAKYEQGSLCSASAFFMLSRREEDFAMQHQTVLEGKRASPGVCKIRLVVLTHSR